MTGTSDHLKPLRVTGLSVLAYLLMLSYALARPTVEGLFLKIHKPSQLPVVWLLVAVAVVAAVALYARVVDRVEQMRLFSLTAVASALLLAALLVGREAATPGVDYFLYTWKDVYVVLLVEIYYSYANSVFAIRTARWVYGLFGFLSGLGGLTGSFVVRRWAETVGAARLLWFVPPLLLLIGGLSFLLARRAGARLPAAETAPTLGDGIRVVARSRYLSLVLLLVAVITLVDYQFNEVAERTFDTEDRLSAMIATVYGAISVVTLALHAATGPVLRLVGVPLTLLTVPLLLGGGLTGFVVRPVFAAIAAVKAASKCFDYSIFRTAKEILYIPLSFEEKTRGKFVVDMITYRVAKGGASLLLLGLVTAAGAGCLVTPLNFLLVAGWLLTTLAITRRFRGLVSRDQELRSRGHH
jgi:ATP/ADP translocase